MKLLRSLGFALVLVCSQVSAAVAPSLPAQGGWSWGQVLKDINNKAAGIGANCKLWTERYGTSSFRTWSRCGVDTVPSGAILRDVSFPSKAGPVHPTLFTCGGISCIEYKLATDGSLVTVSGPAPTEAMGVISANQSTKDPGVLREDGGFYPFSLSDGVLSCTGALIPGGGIDTVVTSQGLVWSRSGSYLRDVSPANNTIGPQCRAADKLISDYGEVAPSCQANVTVSAIVRGREVSVGDCTCPPIGEAISQYSAPNTCSFVRITGDPAGYTTATATPPSPGAQVTKPGSTFTNADLIPFGDSDLPIAGSSPTGGQSPGYGLPGAAGSAAPSAGTGGTGSGPGGIGAGGSGGTGAGCAPGTLPANCKDSPIPDTAEAPGVPTLDPSIVIPGESEYAQNWPGLITAFLAGNPLVAAFSGSTMTASGSCDATANVMGASVSLGFSMIPAIIWSVWGGFVVLTTHVAGFLYLFRG